MCPHIRTFTSIRICIYPYVHMYTHTCEYNLHMFTCSVINTCELIHTIEENRYRVPCMHTHPCMPRAHIHTCLQIHSHINIYTYIWTNAYMHTHDVDLVPWKLWDCRQTVKCPVVRPGQGHFLGYPKTHQASLEKEGFEVPGKQARDGGWGGLQSRAGSQASDTPQVIVNSMI